MLQSHALPAGVAGLSAKARHPKLLCQTWDINKPTQQVYKGPVSSGGLIQQRVNPKDKVCIFVCDYHGAVCPIIPLPEHFKQSPAGLSPQTGPGIPVTLLRFGPGSPLSGPLGLTVEHGHQPLLQTKILLTFSSTSSPTKKKKKSKPAGRKGEVMKKKDRQKESPSLLSAGIACHIRAIPSPPPAAPERSLGKVEDSPAFLQRQGKKLTFPALQHSPYSPASHSILQQFKCALAQLFSLKYQTLQRVKKKSLSIAGTQAKNNPFLVTRATASFPSLFQHSVCSFLCCICSKCEKAKDISHWSSLLHSAPPGRVLRP